MDISQQVTNQELSAKLKALGVKQESFWYWTGPKNRIDIYQSKLGHEHACSAFSVAELGIALPEDTPSDKTACWMQVTEDGDGDCFWDRFCERDDFTPHLILEGKNEADKRALMLIYCIENKLIDVSSVNARIRGEK